MPLILGIETSCDETAASVVADGRDVRCNIIASQHDLHARYGGVVPEIASRAHLERIGPVVAEALQKANCTFDDLDAVAVGNRPGLIGSLLVGTTAASTIAWAAGKPLIGVDHIHAHLYAATMTLPVHRGAASASTPAGKSAQDHDQAQIYPAMGLVVSGGHTSLYTLEAPTRLCLVGRTIDDAVGEAYDKAAVILSLGYPGGPNLDRAARRGDPGGTRLPRSLLDEQSLDFSFSGLKTALLYAVRGVPRGRGSEARFERSADDLNDTRRLDLAASFQDAAVDVLIRKLERALDQAAAKGASPATILIGGGVSANSLLRERAADLAGRRGVEVLMPPLDLCIDNAAMIAGLAHEQFQQQDFADLELMAMARSQDSR
jgi:N6-L-threonylcarbamoyladenine synthase